MVEKSSVVEQGSGYRADIQGLRAIAVLLVITFHAGLPVVGGFLGVDVFFVISGFVITSMLLREWHTYGRIRLATFWRRRFFRLTPALALTVFVVFILAALILLPLQQQVAYQTGLGALFFVANIVIARNTGGYFDAPAERNPLLNTWSLSVEEQFYLLFPLLLAGALVIWRRNRRLSWMPTAMVALTALLSICCMLWALSPSG
nr:acyltransferase [Actinomycetes bacterium]